MKTREGGDESVHLRVPLQASEFLLSFENRQADPAADHRRVAPALDVSRRAPDGAHHILDSVRGGQRSGQRARQTQLQDGERLFEPFAKGRRVFVSTALEPGGEMNEELSGRGGRLRLVGLPPVSYTH